MNSRELVRWSRLHERRARAGWWSSPWLVAIVAGGLLAAFVGWRADRAGAVAASHAWLAGTIAAYALAFMRVPFHLYWRADASLLAQLPIEGGPLFDAALLRCMRAAAATTLAAVIGAVPLAIPSLSHPEAIRAVVSGEIPLLSSVELFVRHVVVAGVLGLAAALLLPAVATWGATLVAAGQHASGTEVLKVATALGGAPVRASATQAPAPGSSTTILGALPGFASSIVIVLVIIVSSWLWGGTPRLPPLVVLSGLAAASVAGIVIARAGARRVMGTVLRDVSALDRQRLASLEIRPPTAIERAIAGMLGEAALPYRKDARLVRRRYPMAYALGALAFFVLAIIGLSRPDDPTPYLVVTLAGAAMYGIALGGRLHRPPIELPRLSSTLPISPAARNRAKLVWVLAWWVIFIAAPATFAIVRNRDSADAWLLAAATIAVAVSARGRREHV
ncbi:MAG: hypothetical protein JWO36_5939 [Myxococcales bacterium]|nr:hypothetical protein [Myxococcales bacterium]